MKHPVRTSFLLVAAALFAAAPNALAQSRNVLLIIGDDVGAENIGAYHVGRSPPPTPNIDSIASRGVLFRNAWSNPLCSPTRAGILTGRHAFRTGVGVPVGAITNSLEPSETTLPEILAPAGYRSAHLGKWHLSNAETGGNDGPGLAGVEYFAGCISGGFVPPYNFYNWPKVINGVSSVSTTYATTDTVDEAVNWIGSHSGPWFVTVSFNAAHAPYHEPPADLHTYDLAGLDPATDPRPFYKADIQAMAAEIGRLLASLGDARSQTTIIFLGDNGTPGEVVDDDVDPAHAKGTAYQGGVNVPFIVSGPTVVSPGRETTALINTLDIFASVAALAGVDARASVPADVHLDAVSFLPVLSRVANIPVRASAYTETFVGDNPNAGTSAIRGLRYKIIFKPRQTEEFYDLQADPHETVNLLPVDSLTPDQLAAYTQLHAQRDALLASEPQDLACDWDASGSVDSSDFFLFITDFFAGAGDFNGDGSTSSDDFFGFLSCFFSQ